VRCEVGDSVSKFWKKLFKNREKTPPLHFPLTPAHLGQQSCWWKKWQLIFHLYRIDQGIRNTSRQISFEFLFIKTRPPDKLHNGFGFVVQFHVGIKRNLAEVFLLVYTVVMLSCIDSAVQICSERPSDVLASLQVHP
jgi:hypothetical protein